MQTYDADGELEDTESTVDEIVAEAKTQASLDKSFQMVYSYIDNAGNEGTATRRIILMNSPFDDPEIIHTGRKSKGYRCWDRISVDAGIHCPSSRFGPEWPPEVPKKDLTLFGLSQPNM